jgi:glyoxylase-like metal-dependent hydrolase (beta-lactamase superfamily II)/protein-S-isoprenylcysteine O-methyltransferase Ste14
MKKEMTVWGVGLRFSLLSLACAALALGAHFVWYPLFVIRAIPYGLLVTLGVILMAIGIPIWVMAGIQVDRAFEEGVLATQGMYALCRHPIYGNGIFFTLPGVLLFFRSWLLLLVPVATYLIGRLLIQEEEEYLRQKFGPAYRDYERQVNPLFPRVWKLRAAWFYPVPTGQIAEHVYAVQDGNVNAFIYADRSHAIAIDTGYTGDMPRKELARLAIPPGSVPHVFLTHGDVDHAGGLDAFPDAQIYLGRGEEQMVDGTTPRLFGVYHSPRIARPTTALADGQVVTVGSITVQAIATPGHTPGSTSYLVNGSVLFTGDTLALQDGLVRSFYRVSNKDTAREQESIRKLARLEGVTLLCTAHTGCTDDFALSMRRWRAEGEG